MARISKEEHPRILHMVDGENRRVADVAAEYGCTPANIYALVARLRRAASPDAAAAAVAAPSAAPPEAAPAAEPPPRPEAGRARRSRMAATPAPSAGAATLELPLPTGKEVDRGEPRHAVEPPRPAPAPPPPPHATVPPAPAPAPRPSPPQRDAARGKGGGVGAARARPGVGLMMRTVEGEESLTPFRSLEDLLSAVKPILRAAARSPDLVWFCIQPVDLATLEDGG